MSWIRQSVTDAAYPQRDRFFSAAGTQHPPFAYPSRQSQDWTRNLQAGGRRSVIAERSTALPAFSAKGIRLDMLAITVTVLLVLFAGILFSDLGALRSEGWRVSQLSARNASLEDSNNLLREEIAILSDTAYARVLADRKGEENPRVIMLELAPSPEPAP